MKKAIKKACDFLGGDWNPIHKVCDIAGFRIREGDEGLTIKSILSAGESVVVNTKLSGEVFFEEFAGEMKSVTISGENSREEVIIERNEHEVELIISRPETVFLHGKIKE